MNSYSTEFANIEAGEALAKYRRVKLSAGTAIYADAGEDFIGITMAAVVSGGIAKIKLPNDSGTFLVTAAGAFAVDAILYGAVDGKVASAVSGDQIGQSIELASADGDLVEMVIPKQLDQGSPSFINVNAGASGTAGSVNVYPSTASKGKISFVAADNAGDTTTTFTNASHGQATVITFPDSGLATSYVPQSTDALTVAEIDVLDTAIAGTQVASKVVIADANVNTGVSKVTELHIGATGSEVQVTATPAELNYLDLTGAVGTQEASKAVVADANVNTGVSKVTELHIGATGAETQVTSTGAELNYLDISAQSETVTTASALSPSIFYSDLSLSGAGAVTLAAPNAAMLGRTKVIEMVADNGDVTLNLGNCVGGSATSSCKWENVGEALILVGGVAKWIVVGEGGVTLS